GRESIGRVLSELLGIAVLRVTVSATPAGQEDHLISGLEERLVLGTQRLFRPVRPDYQVPRRSPRFAAEEAPRRDQAPFSDDREAHRGQCDPSPLEPAAAPPLAQSPAVRPEPVADEPHRI